MYKCSECGREFKRPIELANHKKWKKIRDEYSQDPKLCGRCKKPLAWDKRNNKFCGKSCANSKENNPMYGKVTSKETKKKISDKIKGVNHPWYGKHHTEETKKKISESRKGKCVGKDNPFFGKKHSEEVIEKIRKSKLEHNKRYEQEKKLFKKNNIIEKNRRFWKGGYDSKNIPRYDTYAPQIEWCEEVRRNREDPNILEVKCFKCDKWYTPRKFDVIHRIQVLKGQQNGEQRFYCSEQCKHSCYIYGKSPEILMKEDAVRAGRFTWTELGREVQGQLRQMVLARDNNECQKCGETENVQCHHIYPVNIEPLLSADIDNCITLCYNCHKEVHTKDGCKLHQLHMEEC